MYRFAPSIERRSAQDIFAEITRNLGAHPRLEWSGADPATEALVHIFARYWEIITDRLNKAPDKHFLAYLDMLGISPIAPIPAWVPLTFVPVPNAPGVVRVPAQTQVAAPAGAGETEPVIFETERPLELTTATLRHVFLLDPLTDRDTELGELADAVVPEVGSLFSGSRSSDHLLFIGHTTLFSLPSLTQLRLKFEVGGLPQLPYGQPVLEWTVLGSEQTKLTPSTDTTKGFTRSGEVVFDNLETWPEQELQGLRSRWLVCRLLGGLTVAERSSWEVRRIEPSATVTLRNLPIDAALSDGVPVDLSKDFFPLGQRPVFGSTLYLSGSEIFCHPGARVVLNVELTNPFDAEESPIPVVNREGHPRIHWEYWNGLRWNRLMETDQTKAFRVSGDITFQTPADAAPTIVGGLESCWIRARLVSGNYGEEERWDPVDPLQPGAGPRRRPATLAPPSIKSLTGGYDLTVVAAAPQFTLTCNERVYDDLTERMRSGQPSPLFGFACGPNPALYLGFEPSPSANFVNHSIALYLRVKDRAEQLFTRSGAMTETPFVEWQFWDGSGWRHLNVVDETESLTFSGIVGFIVPAQLVSRTNFSTTSPVCWFWFRLVCPRGSAERLKRIHGILRNTVFATNTTTIENEILGSGNGAPLQRFKAARNPIGQEVQLQVREATSILEIEHIRRDVPMDAIEIRRDEFLKVEEVWVLWNEVPDFIESTERDRHYVLDHETGEIRFGDGQHGCLPPRGNNNIRLRRYHTNGGAQGNKSARQINQLRTAIPYVDSVTNFIAGEGGFDLEDVASVRDRGAAPVRHRGRAVTCEDHEDLARLASPEVARAKCIPMRDLASDPAARRLLPGVVSLVIVPAEQAGQAGRRGRPLPSVELLRRVQSYLDRQRNPSTDLVVIGPVYVQVSIEAELIVSSVEEAGSIVANVTTMLHQFLHPLSGGPSGQGWRFGELPRHSDFLRRCAAVSGVDRVNSLVVSTDSRPGIMEAGYFLICSGSHVIKLGYGDVSEQNQRRLTEAH